MLNHKPKLSLEIMPDINFSNQILFNKIQEINPEFISIARGFDGSNNINELIDFCDELQNDYNFKVCTHIIGRYLKRGTVKNILQQLNEINVSKILLLRGDIKDNQINLGDFNYADELISYTKKINYTFEIIAACYPEKHPESSSLNEDINHLKNKINQGVNELITQFLFDNNQLFYFTNKLKENDIDIPIIVGIMPIISYQQLDNMLSFNQVSLPKNLRIELEKAKNNPEKIKEIGINYAINQIINLIENGFKNIHLYTMNNDKVLNEIWNGIKKYF
ncbi:hypothetical protein GSH19_06185 [Lactobacillus sp. S2-2]|uniref:methylenetetrahydrofolate reductase n=1 Tax=Lactobacillus sp. S2-2 TaxID=2692917 RepID=UPI001F3003BA|nr:methylenetetrahydrofolate reductase [Lactobacillus sp. S2-2]MCF6515735.1 hypothetical protein [Lactobacillus sp. S2-2]